MKARYHHPKSKATVFGSPNGAAPTVVGTVRRFYKRTLHADHPRYWLGGIQVSRSMVEVAAYQHSFYPGD